LQGLLIDPRQAKRVPGQPQTARLDCTWLQRLHTYGGLAGAFRPADQVCVLRSSWRHRQMLLTYAAHPLQHMHKAFEQMHRTLTQVVRASTGVTGLALLQAILAGERAPQRLAKLRNPPCHHTEGRHRQGAAGHLARRTPVCLTPSGRAVCLLAPAERAM
jgi:transposase